MGGRSHTCLLYRGNVRCWGKGDYNGYGIDLGRFRPASSVPNPLEFQDQDSPIIQMALGLTHSCVLFEDGTVRCWGENSGVDAMGITRNGKLGNGSTLDIIMSSEAENVMIPEGVIIEQIAAGNDHTCGIGRNEMTDDINVYCWGFGDLSRLGNDMDTDIGDTPGDIPSVAATPAIADPPGLNEFAMSYVPAKVSPGADHTCVLYKESVDCRHDLRSVLLGRSTIFRYKSGNRGN